MDEAIVRVGATGTARVVPDQVRVLLAVEATAPALGASLRAASEGVDRLVAVLERAGVAEADRQTTGLTVHPAWDPATGAPHGHTASYGLQVVVRDLDAAGRTVQAAAEQVGDRLRVHGFGLSVRDRRPAQSQARRAAVEACRTSAEELAVAAGRQLGALLSLTEGLGAAGTARDPAPLQAAAQGLAVEGLAVERGRSEVTVEVVGTWALVSAGPRA